MCYWNSNEDNFYETWEISVPPFKVHFKSFEETQSLYMMNRFKLGFYSLINIDQHTNVKHIKIK